MERKEYIKSRKYFLKGLAQQLRELKRELRQYYDDRNTMKWSDVEKKYKGRYSYKIESDIKKAKYEFRHQHIAYCLARGRSYEQIESKVRENNEPNQEYIRELLESYPALQAVDNEAVVRSNS